ncbi:MAG: peptide chain release factor N(5)-glutamine methyltransferase [Peptococcaceae bacterium]|nr:peptide chain release factor N(5)-glutamine methyltransferase [Peptococcaceae bacterium]
MTARGWLKEAVRALDHMERFELEVLLSERLQMSRAHLLAHLDDALSAEALAQLARDVEKLSRHVPLQYVLGQAYFMDACYFVNEDVLIPRFDTEYLVQAVLDRVTAPQARVLDLCTGSGIIAISLARARKDWQLSASDLSEAALAVARKNGAALGAAVDWRLGDLFAPWTGARFDAIVSNPPYIAAAEYETLSPEVHQEPQLALVAADDGLAFYERLTREAPAYLSAGGWLAVEIGWQQGEAVRALFINEKFKEVACLQDGQGHDRVVIGHL